VTLPPLCGFYVGKYAIGLIAGTAHCSYSGRAMFYSISGKNWCAAVVTSDGVVLRATENFAWACGEEIREILEWAAQHRMRWSVSAIVPPGLVLRDAMKGTSRALRLRLGKSPRTS
jgi:hypothetical protein